MILVAAKGRAKLSVALKNPGQGASLGMGSTDLLGAVEARRKRAASVMLAAL
jgi:hypothetical protein